jgi:hypothetical protein
MKRCITLLGLIFPHDIPLSKEITASAYFLLTQFIKAFDSLTASEKETLYYIIKQQIFTLSGYLSH